MMIDLKDNPLSNRLLYQSSDFDEVKQLLAHAPSPHDLTISNGKKNSFIRFDGVKLTHAAIMHVYCGPESRILPINEVPYFFVQTMLDGHCEISNNSSAITVDCDSGMTAVLSPSISYDLKLQKNSRRLILMLERKALESYLSQLINIEINEPLVFELKMPCDTGVTWLQALWYQCLQRNSINQDVLDRPEIQQYSSDMLMSLLLYLQPHNYSHYLCNKNTIAPPRHIQRAIGYIEENIHQSFLIDDVACYVGVTVRTLQKGFQRYVKQTPTEFVRAARLAHIHRELKASRAENTQVTEVLLQNGILSQGHFSRYYKLKYGVTPSETLRKS